MKHQAIFLVPFLRVDTGLFAQNPEPDLEPKLGMPAVDIAALEKYLPMRN